METIYLHIGTHKTGSTSLQRWLADRQNLLSEQGYKLFRGKHIPTNHIELYLAAMRYDRDSFAKHSLKHLVIDENYTLEVAQELQAYLSETTAKSLIMTCEGVSLLRHDDEVETLKSLFGTHAEKVKIVLYLRNKRDFLESYRAQLLKRKDRLPAADYWSALYVEDDTWLTDYEKLIEVFSNGFGSENLSIVDYDKEMASFENVIPSFLDVVGLEISEGEADWNDYTFNKTTKVESEGEKS